ncbi:MAG: phosphopentomutase, partial [Bacillota bacterium]
MKDVPEVRPQDQGANTLLTVWDQYPELSLPSLASLGLWSAAGLKAPRGSHRLSGSSYGRCALAHEGADTYMGHQELMGTRPFPASRQLMRDVGPAVLAALHAAGLDACYAPGLESAVLVEGQVVVADNMEADPGQNINVTGSLDFIPFERLVAIGKIVRSAVQVSRVIVVGGRGYDREGILRHAVRRGGQQGIDTPGLGVYDENYMVRHLGLGVDVQQQVPTILNAAGFAVVLLGKAADVVECEGAALRPMV